MMRVNHEEFFTPEMLRRERRHRVVDPLVRLRTLLHLNLGMRFAWVVALAGVSTLYDAMVYAWGLTGVWKIAADINTTVIVIAGSIVIGSLLAHDLTDTVTGDELLAWHSPAGRMLARIASPRPGTTARVATVFSLSPQGLLATDLTVSGDTASVHDALKGCRPTRFVPHCDVTAAARWWQRALDARPGYS